MKFTQRLKELREKTGLSQDELAAKLEIPRSSIAHYESGDNDRLPRHDRLKKIAEFFNVGLDYLLGTETDTEIIEKIPNDRIRVILEKFENLEATLEDYYVKKIYADFDGQLNYDDHILNHVFLGNIESYDEHKDYFD